MKHPLIVIVLFTTVLFSIGTKASDGMELLTHDPYCLSELMESGHVGVVADKIEYWGDIIIMYFRDRKIIITPDTVLKNRSNYLGYFYRDVLRGYVPIGSAVAYPGETWISITTAFFTNENNEDKKALTCITLTLQLYE